MDRLSNIREPVRHANLLPAVRCAPPDNKPTPEEITNCHQHLVDELDALPNLKVYVVLGRIAFDAALRLFKARGWRAAVKPAFAHGRVVELPGAPPIVCAYHPSRQNTHTGRLTADMLASAFATAKQLAGR